MHRLSEKKVTPIKKYQKPIQNRNWPKVRDKVRMSPDIQS
jgi:hypothetical protein